MSDFGVYSEIMSNFFNMPAQTVLSSLFSIALYFLLIGNPLRVLCEYSCCFSPYGTFFA